MKKEIIIKKSMIILIILFSIELFVRCILSEFDTALFFIGLNTMILAAIMMVVLIINIIIFLYRVLLKKKKCFGKSLSRVSIVTLILVLSTVIIFKEESRYYHVINSNWKISLPRQYEEIYYKDSGPSFHGDGERYSVFKYKNIDKINTVVEWKDKSFDIEPFVGNILKKLDVPKEYSPDINRDFKYYYQMKEDRSEICMILNDNLNIVYIVEHFQ